MNSTNIHGDPGSSPSIGTDRGGFLILDSGNVIRAETYGCKIPGREEANAALLAAAPDLLGALEEYVDEVERRQKCIRTWLEDKLVSRQPKRLYLKAKAAISRAKRKVDDNYWYKKSNGIIGG